MALVDSIQNKIFAIFGTEKTDIDLITGIVDAYPEENHSLKVTKTKYPVEDGSSRTDNFVVEPESLILRGLVSDLQTPLIPVVSISNNKRTKEAWGRLRALKNSGDLVTVVTQLATYENMLVTAVDSTVSKETGKALSFTITLEETLIAETETVQLSPAKVDGPAETKGSDIDGGLKQSEVPAPEKQTLLLEVSKSIAGIF